MKNQQYKLLDVMVGSLGELIFNAALANDEVEEVWELEAALEKLSSIKVRIDGRLELLRAAQAFKINEKSS